LGSNGGYQKTEGKPIVDEFPPPEASPPDPVEHPWKNGRVFKPRNLGEINPENEGCGSQWCE